MIFRKFERLEARSHCVLLIPEERIQKFVDTEENKARQNRYFRKNRFLAKIFWRHKSLQFIELKRLVRSWGSGEVIGVDLSSSSSSSSNRLFFFVKQKVAIARVVASEFLDHQLWGAKNRVNCLFFVYFLYAIERGSSPVHGTICKIARFVDFEKLCLTQVSLVSFLNVVS